MSKENNLLEEKLTELEIQKLRLLKYKEIIKNAKTIWCDECNREYKPALFNAHLKVKCWERQKESSEIIEPTEIEVINIKFENVLEVDFLVKDFGCCSKSFEETVKMIASFINPDS